ncbi:Card1-like endonuclease domain-containing protein [Gilvimarinus sp. DA14]|uniref:Card1-like endonuclease domain-containing protein n=1 Tax=Gilvimarinus sp. DA14 TaxID=2956798 RepID=UPI0020B65F1D|nr:DUF1887 family CARF protein [Gilvimarinus sp. DA14]UTF61601.1 DUF1887 family CARF protein [Gilvimarinus sp. DA14]
MDSHSTQFLIISDHPNGNLMPLTDSRLKPDEVVLLTPPGEHLADYQHWLIQVCQPMGIRCTTIELAQPWDIEQLRQTLEELVVARLAQGENLILNNSGTKGPIGIIAHEVFFYRNLPAFYVRNDQVYWLCNPDNRSSFNLEDKIKLPAFLQSHGLKVTHYSREGIARAQRDIAERWLLGATSYSKAMGILNYYASRAESGLSTRVDHNHLRGNTPFNQLLDDLAQHQLVQLKGNELSFSSEEARFFANGGWMEELVFSELLKLRGEFPQLQDLARSVQLNWLESRRQRPVRNELDVLALYNNRLIAIECKTSRFEQGNGKKVVYKLGAMLKHLGGPSARGLIVSFHPIKQIHCERAELFDVHVCERSQLGNLTHLLRTLLKELQ